jgi:hypothetical protein
LTNIETYSPGRQDLGQRKVIDRFQHQGDDVGRFAMVLTMLYGRVGCAVALGNRFVVFVGLEIDAGARGTSTTLYGRPTTSSLRQIWPPGSVPSRHWTLATQFRAHGRTTVLHLDTSSGSTTACTPTRNSSGAAPSNKAPGSSSTPPVPDEEENQPTDAEDPSDQIVRTL